MNLQFLSVPIDSNIQHDWFKKLSHTHYNSDSDSVTSIQPLEVPISSSREACCKWGLELLWWVGGWWLRNEDLKRGLLLVYANLVQVNYIIMRHFFIHASETRFHRKGCALGLNLKVGFLEVRSGLLSSLQRRSTVK